MKKTCLLILASMGLAHLTFAQATKMDVGPSWMNTFGDSFLGNKRIAAIKGLSVNLGDGWRGLYDTETLRLVSVGKGEIEWGGTPWTGGHGSIVSFSGNDSLLTTATGYGWTDSAGSFDDHRLIKGYGDMPHGKFAGHFRHGREIVLKYTINGVEVLEHLSKKSEVLTRSFQFGARDHDLTFVVSDSAGFFEISGNIAKSDQGVQFLAGDGIKLSHAPNDQRRLLATVSKGNKVLIAQIAFGKAEKPVFAAKPNFTDLTSGGPGIWPDTIVTEGKVSAVKNKTYVADTLTLPSKNPWAADMRFGGFDFIDENSAALSSWNGDVWIVTGLAGDWKQLKWRRIAAGLFEPLGLKVVNGIIHVNGRDQITQLIDLNGDGETDHFKVFNRDVYVSANFHEFAFDLETDQAGNFYFAKGGPVKAGGRNFDEILPHHGIVAKISPDGKKFEVVATGLRTPGGMSVGPNGEITTGENEGTWQPACKLNFINQTQTPAFFGTEQTRRLPPNVPFTEPMLYFPMDVDNSGGSQVWVPEGVKFGLKSGELIHLSYGQSSLYRILPTLHNGKLHGGAVKLPIKLESSAMRARFHSDSSLYVMGFRGWQTNAAREAAFQRIRYNREMPLGSPEKMVITEKGILLSFSKELDPELVEDISSFNVQRWDYVRGAQYGSGEFSVDHPDAAARAQALLGETQTHRKRDTVKVESAKLSADGKTVELILENMKPCLGLKVAYDLETTDGEVFNGTLHTTIYEK